MVVAAAVVVLAGLAAAGLLAGAADPPAGPVPPPSLVEEPAPSGYRLVWSDEFTGDALDPAKWNVRDDQNYGATLGVDQCYRAENVAVHGGRLHLRLARKTVTCGGINPDTGEPTYYFTSGAVTTRADRDAPQRFAFTRGYVEAAIRLPQGNAYWGAFWHTGGDGAPPWPEYGELDVMEQDGGHPDLALQTVHYRCSTAASCDTGSDHRHNVRTGSTDPGPPLTGVDAGTYPGATTSRFVRYGLLWDEEQIAWYVDGEPVRGFDGERVRRYATDAEGRVTVAHTGQARTPVRPSWPAVLDTSHAIDLNLAYGGALPRSSGYTGGETATGYDDGNVVGEREGTMEIEYVRVYQLP
ncbi:hypothetical protein GCM10009788_35760 [Nocardioides humi]|uniref:GH16 domain-containing protein n=1 Tax=Nocardioides humi TaxID=449461 RepID=A0ABN2AZJ4_9ACTN